MGICAANLVPVSGWLVSAGRGGPFCSDHGSSAVIVGSGGVGSICLLADCVGIDTGAGGVEDVEGIVPSLCCSWQFHPSDIASASILMRNGVLVQIHQLCLSRHPHRSVSVLLAHISFQGHHTHMIVTVHPAICSFHITQLHRT